MAREWLVTVATNDDSFTGCFTGDESCDSPLMQARVSRLSGGSYAADIDDDIVRDGTLTADWSFSAGSRQCEPTP